MEILAKQEVERFGRYLVMEGPVLTPDHQEIALCWVEDADGAPVTSFTSRDIACDLACRLAEYDYDVDPENGMPDAAEDRQPRRLH